MTNLRFKGELIAHYGSQGAAAKALGITERRLSRLIHGFDEPKPREKRIIREKLGLQLNSEPAEAS